MPRVSAVRIWGQGPGRASARAICPSCARHQRLHRRRGGEQQEPAPVERGATQEQVPRVQARRARRLVGRVVLVDQGQRGRGRQRGEQGGAGADHHAAAPARGREPGAAPLRLGHPAVEADRVEPARPARGGLAVGRDDERGAGLPLEMLGEPGLAGDDPPRARARARDPAADRRAARPSRPRRVAARGGSRDRRVEPHDERLSPAAQRVSSSAASDSTGTGSTARWSGFSAVASPSRSPTTTPTRLRPWSGALTRWPRVTSRPAGTA